MNEMYHAILEEPKYMIIEEGIQKQNPTPKKNQFEWMILLEDQNAQPFTLQHF